MKTVINFVHLENSWCKYKKDQITNLPHWMLKVLRPIFEELIKEELLKQCLDSETQNANESFNNIVWLKCPKPVYVNRQSINKTHSSEML